MPIAKATSVVMEDANEEKFLYIFYDDYGARRFRKFVRQVGDPHCEFIKFAAMAFVWRNN